MMGGAAMSWESGMAVEGDVAQLRRGDLDALSTLVTRYQNRLYRYLLRMVRQPAEAEDLFQVTWVRVAEKIRHYDPQRNFEAWLFTVARNGEQPSLEVSLWIVVPNFLRHPYPGHLEQVLGLRRLAHHAEQIAVQPVLIPRHQRRQRVQIPSPKLCYVTLHSHSALPGHCRAAHHIGTTAKPAEKTHAS